MSHLGKYRERFEAISDFFNPPEIPVILLVMLLAVVAILANLGYSAIEWLWDALCLGC